MARRKSEIQSFLEGFSGVYGTATDAMSKIKASQIARAKVEETEGEDGTMSYSFLGKDYTEKPSDADINYQRNMAMGANMQRFGDAAGGLRMQTAASQQKALDDKAAMSEKSKEWYLNSRQGRAAADYTQKMGEWEQADKEYQKQIAAGHTPQSLGMPPARPPAPTLTHLDALSDAASYLSMQAANGEYDPKSWMQLGKEIESVRKEGVVEALRALQAGDLDTAVDAFNKTGSMKLDRANIVSFGKAQAEVSGTTMPTYELKYKDESGQVRTINAFNQLDAYGQASEAFSRGMSVRSDGRAAQAAGRAAQSHAATMADRQERQVREAGARAASEGLFNEQNPQASEAQRTAARFGVLKPETNLAQGEKSAASYALWDQQNPQANDVERRAARAGVLAPATSTQEDKYKPLDANIRAQLSTPKLDDKGQPVIDAISGKPVMLRNFDAENELMKFMADNDITDANKGLVLWNQHKRAVQRQEAEARDRAASEARAAALKAAPKDEAVAQAAVIREIKRGALTLEAGNRRLQELGFRPVEKK